MKGIITKSKSCISPLLLVILIMSSSCTDNITPPEEKPQFSNLKGSVILENQKEHSNALSIDIKKKNTDFRFRKIREAT